jgi:hypothetical protein
MEVSMKRIALALASAGLLAAAGGFALAQTSDIRPGADSGAANPNNTAPAAVAPNPTTGGAAATTGATSTGRSSGAQSGVSGSTEPQGTHRRHASASRHGQENSPEAQRITRALNALEASGYGNFTNFQPSGNGFTATVNKDGRQMNVMVDPDSGQVRPQG